MLRLEPTQEEIVSGGNDLRHFRAWAPYRFGKAVMLWRPDYQPEAWRVYSDRAPALRAAKRAKLTTAFILDR